jgi:hypothetical protein
MEVMLVLSTHYNSLFRRHVNIILTCTRSFKVAPPPLPSLLDLLFRVIIIIPSFCMYGTEIFVVLPLHHNKALAVNVARRDCLLHAVTFHIHNRPGLPFLHLLRSSECSLRNVKLSPSQAVEAPTFSIQSVHRWR